jgi:hypothetical protein
MQLRWTPSFSVSALHAAEAIVAFPKQITDASFVEAIGSFSTYLGQWSMTAGFMDSSRFWPTLIATAAEIESNYELVETTLRKCGRSTDSTTITSLAGRVTDIEAAYKQMFPKFEEQIGFRLRPLQDQWLGYGAGLMAHVSRLTEKRLLVGEARIIPVQPVLGGYGYAHIQNNIARIEAVLTNPLAELPEVVRLAWLVSQLNLDVPVFSETLGQQTLHRLAPLAMLPPVLAAAQVVEQSSCTSEMAALAIEHWHIPVPLEASVQDDIAPTLMDWWETYLQTRPEWHIAMQALSKMLLSP